MLYPALHVLTAVSVGYAAYSHLWQNVISLFERVQSSRPLIHTQSFHWLLSSDSESPVGSAWWHLIKWSQRAARVAFTITVMATVLAIQFILWQFQNSQINSVDLKLWEWNLWVLVLMIVFVQPALMCVLLFNKLLRDSAEQTKLGSCAAVMICWLVFISKGYLLTDMVVVGGGGVLSYYLQRVSIMGVTLIAILNGVGSYSTVYYYLYKTVTPVDEMDVEAAQKRVHHLEESLSRTEELIKQLHQSQSDQLTQRTNKKPKGSFLDLSMLSRLSRKPTELDTLTKLKNELYIKLMRAQQSLSAEPMSRITTHVNRVISVYCLFKVAQVLVVHLLQYIHSNDINTSRSDPLVITVAHVLELFTSQEEEFLINQLSFIISGALFVLSFNGVFLTLTHVYRFLPIDITSLQQSRKSVSAIKNMILAELLAIYVLATLLILKSNLTAIYSQNLTTLTMTRGMDIGLVDNWFDKVYLLSVVMTGVVIRVGEVWLDEGFEDDQIADKIV